MKFPLCKIYFFRCIFICIICNTVISCQQQRTSKEVFAKLDAYQQSDSLRLAHLRDEYLFRSSSDSILKKDSGIRIIDTVLIVSDSGVHVKYFSRIVFSDPLLSDFSNDTIRKCYEIANDVIYGPDNGADGRMEYYQIQDKSILANANRVVSIFNKRDLEKEGEFYKLSTVPFQSEPLNEEDLCPTERFYNQPKGSNCSGVFIAPNLILTAGHCLDDTTSRYLKRALRFVIGFRYAVADSATTIIPQNHVFTAKRVLDYVDDENGADYAIVETAEKAVDIGEGLKLAELEVALNDSIYVIGHPLGLPLKYAGGATVQQIDNLKSFITDLDTFLGNSGSPVFNKNNELVGVFVRGEPDTVIPIWQRCHISRVCSEFGAPDCKGETVTRLSQFKKFIPISLP